MGFFFIRFFFCFFLPFLLVFLYVRDIYVQTQTFHMCIKFFLHMMYFSIFFDFLIRTVDEMGMGVPISPSKQ